MRKNATPFLLLGYLLFAAMPWKLVAQMHPNQEENKPVIDHEVQDDPYRPNAYGNQRTSPAYHFSLQSAGKTASTSVTTNQANIGFSGQNIIGDAANEPSIAVNPLDENEIVIGWRQFDDIGSNFRQAGWSFSSDGGQTWNAGAVIDPGIFRSDPVLDYDLAGKFYYNSLTNNPNYFCKVFGSTDGGASWDAGTDAGGGDKQWMAIDRTSGVGAGNIYACWSEYYSSCPPGFFTRSTDGNVSYEGCSPIDGSPWRGTMTVGNNGELYIGAMSWPLTDSVMIAKSTNAQIPGSTIRWTSQTVLMDGAIQFGQLINPAGLNGQVSIDVDRSGGPGNGNVYLLAPLTRFSNLDPCDAVFVRSTDGGSTWSAPTVVNDDASTTNVQWFATMSVAPNGRIDAAWLDNRDGHGSDSSALYYAYSIDQGLTWSVNEKLSDLFDPHVGYPNQNKMGDYFDMVSTNAGAHLAWAGTLNGEEDVYHSFIVPAMIAGMNGGAAAAELKVFPNPTQGKVVVQTTSAGDRLTISNALGVQVYAQPIARGNNEVDLSALPTGMYFIKVLRVNGNVDVQKLIRNQ